MAEVVVEIPRLLRGDMSRIKSEVDELISMKEKRKLLSLFIDEVMKGAGQLSEDELVKMGRDFRKGRFEKLKSMGVI